MQGKEYPPEVKSQVMGALLQGQGVNEVARVYQIPKACVSRWKKELSAEQLEQLGTQKKDEIGELLTSYLRENLVTLQVQSVHFRDGKWLQKQSASELAVLHGVVTDKTIRLLEASERASGGE